MVTVISNASPLIGLCKIDCLEILKFLWREIIIPEAVYNEVVVKGSGKIGADTIEKACGDWIKIKALANRKEVKLLQAILDRGEAETIVLAGEIGADLVLLDNKEPRLFAREIDLKILGTIGIVELAWRKGIIDDPMRKLYELRAKGFWLSDRLLERVRRNIENGIER